MDNFVSWAVRILRELWHCPMGGTTCKWQNVSSPHYCAWVNLVHHKISNSFSTSCDVLHISDVWSFSHGSSNVERHVGNLHASFLLNRNCLTKVWVLFFDTSVRMKRSCFAKVALSRHEWCPVNGTCLTYRGRYRISENWHSNSRRYTDMNDICFILPIICTMAHQYECSFRNSHQKD